MWLGTQLDKKYRKHILQAESKESKELCYI